MQNNFDDAILAYKESLKLNPDSAECHFNIASAYNDKQELELALFHFKESASLDPTNHETFYNLGVLYENRGEADVAISYYNKALDICPDFDLALEKVQSLSSREE